MFWDKVKYYALDHWQTTVTGAVGALAVFLLPYGVTLNQAAQTRITGLILAGTLALLGLFSKDANKSGTGSGQGDAAL